MNSTTARTFAAATVQSGGVDGAGAHFVMLHRADYDGGCTLAQARDKARSLTRGES